MTTTNARIKKLRKALDLTQTEFASRIGTTQNALTGYETGRRNPSSSVINNICKEFHVNETWLRTGSGKMFQEMTRSDEIAEFVERVLADESAEFKRRFISAVSRLDDAGWDALERFVDELARQKDQEAAEPVDQHAIWEAEARAAAEEVYRQVLDEKKAEAGYSVSPLDTGDLLA